MMASKLLNSNWRKDKDCNGLVTPSIKSLSSDFLRSKKRNSFILTTCDLTYLKENINYLESYENSASMLFLLCGVYFDVKEIDYCEKILWAIKIKHKFKKVIMFPFYCKKLSWITNQQKDEEIQFDYIINYIKCARFNLVSQLWTATGASKLETTIKNSATFIIDLDAEFHQDLILKFNEYYGNKNMVLSWDSTLESQINKNSAFVETLNASSIKINKDSANLKVILSHTIIKAGFMCLSPSFTSKIFLELFAAYSIGTLESPIYHRLFTFYYGDQISILHSMMDLKTLIPKEYLNKIDWIDIGTSEIVSLCRNKQACLFLPKGNALKYLKG